MAAAPVRGTQLLVGHMGAVLRRPSLVAMEVGWRWLIGIPLLLIFRYQLHQILSAYPLEPSGLNSLDAQNPWVAVAQLANVWNYYRVPVFSVARWLVPFTALAWAFASGLGRSLVLRRMEPGAPWRPVAMIFLQTAWVMLLLLVFLCWFRTIGWVAATHISIPGEPDLIGFSIWTIFISLGYFSAWAVISLPLSIAPLLMLFEGCSAVAAFGRSFRLGKAFTSKVAEINLVMGIVKLALMVLAMVFSAAPLPFSDELGGDALHLVWAASFVFYLIANDYFQVVRLKAFAEFRRTFRA